MGKLYLCFAFLICAPPIIKPSLFMSGKETTKSSIHSTFDTSQCNLSICKNETYSADSNNERQTLFDQALDSYQVGAWDKAEEELMDYIITAKEGEEVSAESFYYYGRIALNTGQYQRAIKSFEKYFQEADKLLVNDKVDYDYALCHLGFDQLKAKELFLAMAQNNGHIYAEDSRRIIGVIQ